MAELNRLQRQIDQHKLNHCIRLKSATSHIEDEYRQASLLVMSSRYEGLPMVLLEAQSFGLPIVSFACKCGPKDVITEGEDGFLVPKGSISVLADSLGDTETKEKYARFADAYEFYLRKRMGETALKSSYRFMESAIMQRWEKLFDSLSI